MRFGLKLFGWSCLVASVVRKNGEDQESNNKWADTAITESAVLPTSYLSSSLAFLPHGEMFCLWPDTVHHCGSEQSWLGESEAYGAMPLVKALHTAGVDGLVTEAVLPGFELQVPL